MFRKLIQAPVFVALRRHPIFPVVIFILVSLAAGEFYPLSPYSMYSNPSARPLKLYIVADGSGEALPIRWHTGVSPAALTKKFGTHRGDLEDTEPSLTETEIADRSGSAVLEWLRDLSMLRRKRELTEPIQLVELSISIGDDGQLAEAMKVVAGLGPAELEEKP